MEGEYRETSGVGEMEHSLDEIREIGKGHLFKGKKSNFILKAGFDRKLSQCKARRISDMWSDLAEQRMVFSMLKGAQLCG